MEGVGEEGGGEGWRLAHLKFWVGARREGVKRGEVGVLLVEGGRVIGVVWQAPVIDVVWQAPAPCPC